MMAATAIDGAGQIVTLEFGFALSETVESWRFFVAYLAEAVHIGQTPLTVISDRSEWIDTALSEILPMA